MASIINQRYLLHEQPHVSKMSILKRYTYLNKLNLYELFIAGQVFRKC